MEVELRYFAALPRDRRGRQRHAADRRPGLLPAASRATESQGSTTRQSSRRRTAPRATLPGSPVLLISAFGGDGTFPVYGEFDEDGELVRVTVEFVGPWDDE